MIEANLKTFVLTGSTNDEGAFSISHGFSPAGDGDRIVGILVSIQDTNFVWHALHATSVHDNHSSWTESSIDGGIASPMFRQRPVRVIVFTEFIIG